MFAHSLIFVGALSLIVPAQQADAWSEFQEVKPWERNWEQSAPNPFDRFDERTGASARSAPIKPAGPLLLVRWPGAQPFTRLYATPAACGAAARTILLDYAEKERRVRQSGGILNAEPTAVCIPK